MASEILDTDVGQVVATLPDGTEYRQVLLNPTPGETHVTPDGRTWVAVREQVVAGVVSSSPFTIHWKSPSTPKIIGSMELGKAVAAAAQAASERRGIRVGADVHFLDDGFVGVEITDTTATIANASGFAADVVESVSTGAARPVEPITPALFSILVRTWAGGSWGTIRGGLIKKDLIV